MYKFVMYSFSVLAFSVWMRDMKNSWDLQPFDVRNFRMLYLFTNWTEKPTLWSHGLMKRLYSNRNKLFSLFLDSCTKSVFVDRKIALIQLWQWKKAWILKSVKSSNNDLKAFNRYMEDIILWYFIAIYITHSFILLILLFLLGIGC